LSHLVVVFQYRDGHGLKDSELLEADACRIFEQQPSVVSTCRIAIQDANRRMPDRTRLQNWPAFLKNGNQRIEFGLRDRKRRALDRGNPLSRTAKAKVLGRRDDNAGCTVDLLQEFVVYEDAAVLGGYCPASAGNGESVHPLR